MSAPRLHTLLVALLFAACTEPPPPPPPAPPPAPVGTPGAPRSMLGTLRYSEPYYRTIVEEDARRFKVPMMTPDELAVPLAASVEITEPRTLRPGEKIETAHLLITTRIAREWATVGGAAQRFKYEQVVMRITNKGSSPIAYVVETAVDRPEGCRGKAPLSHNAIALGGGETAERTECLWSRGITLKVKRVEVIGLTALGYHYVSRLDPVQIGLEARANDGHTPPKDKICNFIPRREIETSGAAWRDVIDFYARHSCQEYTFFPGYRFRTTAEALPAQSRTAVAAPPVAGESAP